jgi:glycosyltransferase involved in cell wall biosynthesis
VAPRDVEALARSVERLLNDRDLRQRLIRQSLEYARLHTVEAETARMMRVIASHFDLEGLAGGTDIQ